MIHLPALIQDLGLILVVAAIVTLLFRKMKQPVVLGYLIAGFLVSHHVPFLPTVADTASITVWAEIGVIFLLFGLGLEFSFKKLAKVGKSASIIALFEVFFMLGIGYLVGQLFGWTKMDSLFLGGILAISSTTIIVRAFEELGLKNRKFVSLVFGVLIVEDLAAIVLLVLLSTVAVTQSLSGGELIFSSLRLGFFLVLWFLIGIYLLPLFLNKVRDLLTDETALIVSLGLCLMMVILATQVGFSPALGAFIMGSLLAETREGKRIEHLLIPVRDLFAAVFFVSVGMLIDPNVLLEHWQTILLLSLITVAGKLFSTALGTIISGHSLKHAVQSGLSLAQIGEFSFIIATLGMTLKVTGDFLYPIAVAVSAVTTFTTPYLIKSADPFYAWLERKVPKGIQDRLSRYANAISSPRGESSALQLLWQAYGMKLLTSTVLVIAIAGGCETFLLPYVTRLLGDFSYSGSLVGVAALILASPFLWAITLGGPTNLAESSTRPSALPGRDARRLSNLQFGFSIFRFMVALALVGAIVNRFSTASEASIVVLLIFAILLFIFYRFAEPVYDAVEKRFVSNLNENEKEQVAQLKSNPELAPWDATLTEFTVSPNSELVMKKLAESMLKERYGVTIALIQRGSQRILAPGRNDVLLPYDRVFVIGNEEQLLKAAISIEQGHEISSANVQQPHYGLESYLIPAQSKYVGKAIRDSGLREEINGLIVGIERNGKRILSPDSSLVLLGQDLLWLVADQKKVKALTI